MRFIGFLFFLAIASSCGSSKGTKVLRPKTHTVWPKGHKYLIDIPVGTRHIHIWERRRTKTVTMK
ncbi:MAG: hypothetical protein JSS79_12625 [Bacteroidetes bacterium]|nr:hypothetical protein [Bacteroidota bacterium]